MIQQKYKEETKKKKKRKKKKKDRYSLVAVDIINWTDRRWFWGSVCGR